MSVIYYMLHNRRYTGEYRFRELVIPDGIPQIIPIDLFEAAQDKFASYRKPASHFKAKAEYILSTKLFCGKCQSFMIGDSGTSQNGTSYYYYKCSHNKHKKGCDMKAIRKEWIENTVIRIIREHVLADDAAIDKIGDAIVRACTSDNPMLPTLQSQLAKVKTSIRNVFKAIENGLFSDLTNERLKELSEEKKELEIRIAQEEAKEITISKEQAIYWISSFRNGDPADLGYRQRLVDCFIHSVYVYPNKIVIFFNLKDFDIDIDYDEMKDEINLEETLPSCSDTFQSADPIVMYSNPLFFSE